MCDSRTAAFAAALLLGFLLGLAAMLVVIDRLFGGSGPTLTRRVA